MSVSIPVVVLAGGEGRRIGGSKPTRRLAGETLLNRALRLARGWSADVRIAVRSAGDADGAPVLLDDPGLPGPLGGLAAALRHARERGSAMVLAIPCDTPFLPADLPWRLSAAIGTAGAAVAASGDRVHFACGLWRTDCLDRLPFYVASGRRSLKGFAEQVGFVSVDWPAQPIDPFFNINDESQLEKAEALLKR